LWSSNIRRGGFGEEGQLELLVPLQRSSLQGSCSLGG
jgi:hypothetical protein